MEKYQTSRKTTMIHFSHLKIFGKTHVHLIQSYGLFLLSLFNMGLGISLVTLAHLGTTPITSPPYVLSLYLPISFGMLTMLFNLLFVFVEILLLGKDFPKKQYLQFIVGPVLGLAIDFWSYLIRFFPQTDYWLQLSMVIVGCVIITHSTILQIKAQVINNPAEGIVKAISSKVTKEFGEVKLYFDVGLVVMAVVISILAFGTVQGIREGTIISALMIGPLIKICQKQQIMKRNG
ncbi:YczE/YyaS/YitT family protein [Gracilibacillus phocaeensis]|uniref:YczE/YyaS/YitT family protein n=1 Tax=Gracilibacillus phocaeensis TaxID=2042304 RepID=UPI0025711CD7|nr:DUF6198 family protein [Gracilibacillus phocaeensis]